MLVSYVSWALANYKTIGFLEPNKMINRNNVGQLVSFKCFMPLKQQSIMSYVI